MTEQVKRHVQPIDARRSLQLCRLEADRAVTASIADINGRGAMLTTAYRPPFGARVRIRHDVAGTVGGRVSGHDETGITIAFDVNPRATAFALSVLAGAMMRRVA